MYSLFVEAYRCTYFSKAEARFFTVWRLKNSLSACFSYWLYYYAEFYHLNSLVNILCKMKPLLISLFQICYQKSQYFTVQRQFFASSTTFIKLICIILLTGL